ncbi:MAG: T9SS type A sorting domain-containing protein [Bacteroidales bacterium]|nr:T9SS type A sorting domain-containing protein [Bacteroidales bacterium]
MRKIILSFLLVSLTIGITAAQDVKLDWAKSAVGYSGMNEEGSSIDIDVLGNIYTTGYFQGVVDFDPGSMVYNLNAVGIDDIFIQKLDSSGNFIWAKSMGGIGWEKSFAICLDDSGYVYTTGCFMDTVDFDPANGIYNLKTAGLSDIFIQKLNSDGDLIWAKSMGGSLEDEGHSLSIDAFGNVYIVGYFEGLADFDPGSGVFNLTSNGDKDIFITKLDSDGNYIWARSMGGYLEDNGTSIVLDNSGNIYTTGYYNGIVDFDLGSGVYNLTSSGSNDIYIQKLDPNGNFIWAKSLGGNSDDKGNSICLDASGSVYTTGYFIGTIDFDPGSGTYNLSSAGFLSDIFIQKMDSVGNFIWAKSMGNTGWDKAFSICLDNSGDIYTTGYFEGTVDFNPGSGTYSLISAGSMDIFIQKLDSSGSFIWAKAMGGYNWDQANSIRLDAYGNVFTTGYFIGTADFDPGSGTNNLVSTNDKDIFIQRLKSYYPPSFVSSQTNFAAPPFNVMYTNTSIDTINKSWLWKFGDGNSSLLVSPSHTFLYNGTYQTILYAIDTVTGSIDSASAVISCSGLGFTTATKESSIKLSLFPNPNKGRFTLSIDNLNPKLDEMYLIDIYFVTGQLVHSKEIKGGGLVKTNMQMESLSKGMYFLSLKTHNNIIITRFVVQ